MLRTRIFEAFVTRTADEAALDAIVVVAAQQVALDAGETVSVVTEESKEVSERNVNKFCLENPQYGPTQIFRREDYGFGRAVSSNPFLSIMGGANSPRETTLRELNGAVTEWNDELPEGVTRLPKVEQQKLFSNATSSAIKPMHSITANSVNEFKRSTYHLHNCEEQGTMLILIKRIIDR